MCVCVCVAVCLCLFLSPLLYLNCSRVRCVRQRRRRVKRNINLLLLRPATLAVPPLRVRLLLSPQFCLRARTTRTPAILCTGPSGSVFLDFGQRTSSAGKVGRAKSNMVCARRFYFGSTRQLERGSEQHNTSLRCAYSALLVLVRKQPLLVRAARRGTSAGGGGRAAGRQHDERRPGALAGRVLQGAPAAFV